jgi:hypothetical protein
MYNTQHDYEKQLLEYPKWIIELAKQFLPLYPSSLQILTKIKQL